MSKSKQIKVWGTLVLIVLSAATWVYDQVERIDQASESKRLFLRFMDEEKQLDEDQSLVKK